MVHPLFGPEVRFMLQEGDDEGMKTFCETLHPATVAEALTDELSPEEIWRYLQHTTIKNQAAIFEYFPIEAQIKLVEGTGRPHMAKLVEQMSHDDRADLLRRLTPRVREGLLRLVDEADRRDIASLVKYPDNSVGALMTTDYAWLPANIMASEALDRLRLQAPDRETIYYIYVLDDNRRLLGVVSLRDLILAPRHALIRDLMERELVSIRAGDDREKLAQEMARYDLLAIPAVDDEGRMVGIVTHDDVIDVVVEEATEDVHRMGGVGPMAENYLEVPLVKVWWNRAFWLACLFGAELLTFTALAHFEEAIAEVVVLALFVPLCISTGGNSGSQAATLITRAIALNQVDVKSLDFMQTVRAFFRRDFGFVQHQFRTIAINVWPLIRVLRHELLLGIALGLTLGTIGYVRGWLTPEETRKNPSVRKEPFTVRLPASEERLEVNEADRTVRLRRDVVVSAVEAHEPEVSWPEDKSLEIDKKSEPGFIIYRFPPGCTLRHEAVSRWRLALVISQSVAAICLWGTLIGAVLPILFKSFGADPGIASSPFVATFVDVTGIMIFFTIATVWLM
ncbi:MAG: magnesium transporter [Gemmataceae bacterium]|nr:magnesium transporter [Gemmataceae bacterium]